MNRFRICPTPSSQYSRLRRFVNNLLCDDLHGHSRKTLVLITQALLEVRRAVLSELAREIPLPVHFKYRLRRLWRFCAKTTFNYQRPCQALIEWLLVTLKDRPSLEILLDWTQLRQDHVLVFSIPYHKRSIPLFWVVAPAVDFSPKTLERNTICEFLRAVPMELYPKLVFVADRGFADVEFFRFLSELQISFVIRICGKVWIKAKRYQGAVRQLPLASRNIKWLPQVSYHKTKNIKLNLLLKYDKDDPWYIASNLDSADQVLGTYARRMHIEEGFRDIKDGLMFKRLRLSNVEKVGKLLLAGVLAYLFAVLIGSQAEQHPTLVRAVSLPLKSSKKLLSVFRLGLIIIARYPSIKLPLQPVPEIP